MMKPPHLIASIATISQVFVVVLHSGTRVSWMMNIGHIGRGCTLHAVAAAYCFVSCLFTASR